MQTKQVYNMLKDFTFGLIDHFFIGESPNYKPFFIDKSIGNWN